MAFRIFGAITAVTIFRISGLLEDGSACFLGALEMFVYIRHIDVKTLRCLTEPLWVAIPDGGRPIMIKSSPSFIAA